MRKGLVPLGLTILIVVCPSLPAEACACAAVAPFSAAAATAPIVLAGEITAVSGPDQHSFFPGRTSARFVDLHVLRVVKGKGKATNVRVWDAFYGTSCEGLFVDVTPGAEIVLALVTPSSVGSNYRHDIWPLSGVDPAGGDLVASGGCQQVIKRLDNAEDRKRWLGRDSERTLMPMSGTDR